MKKKLLVSGLVLVAAGAQAGKPTDGGDSTQDLVISYVGSTSEPFNRSYAYRGSLVDLVSECVAEYGAGARPATSKEVAAAIYDGSWQQPIDNVPTIILSADPVAVGAASGTTAFTAMRDVHLHAKLDPAKPFIAAGSSGNFSSSYETGYSSGDDQKLWNVACSAPQ